MRLARHRLPSRAAGSPRALRAAPAGLLVALVLVACGCGSHPVPTTSVTPWPRQPSPIDSRLELRLHEALAPEGRTLEVEAATSRDYACSELQWRLGRVGSTFLLTFTGVAPFAGACPEYYGPAKAVVPLGNLAPGSYSLQITVRDEALPARLEVFPDSFVVNSQPGRWMEFATHALDRVPTGTIWGMATFSAPDQLPLVDAFLDTLRARGAFTRTLPPGDYDYFLIDDAGAVSLAGGPHVIAEKDFLFGYERGVASLADAIPFRDSLWVGIWDDRGGFAYSQPPPGAAGARRAP